MVEREFIDLLEDLENFRENSKYLLPYTIQRNIINYGCVSIPNILGVIIGLKELNESIKSMCCSLYAYIRYMESKVSILGLSNSQKIKLEENFENSRKILDIITK